MVWDGKDLAKRKIMEVKVTIKGSAAEKITMNGIEDLTEDQVAEVDRVLMMLRGLRRSATASRDGFVEGVADSIAWEKYCFGESEEDI